jgi:hypothetical protein
MIVFESLGKIIMPGLGAGFPSAYVLGAGDPIALMIRFPFPAPGRAAELTDTITNLPLPSFAATVAAHVRLKGRSSWEDDSWSFAPS